MERILKMKTIFNSGGIEACKQTAKIVEKVAEYVNLIGLNEIRKQMPDLSAATTEEEKENAKTEQGMKNVLEIVNKCLDEHPEQTLEIIGLLIYKTLDEMKDENLALFPILVELFGDPNVVNFLLSLLR